MAELTFYYGAMNCGKSTALLQSAHNYEERGMKVLLLKPLIDTKGDNKIVSRLGIGREVDLLVNDDIDLYDWLVDHAEGISCIFVDEAQFLSRDNVNQLLAFSIELKVPIKCYGLLTDFQSNLFPGSQRLIEVANRISKLTTICRCGNPAQFNVRMINGDPVFEGAQVAIDGDGVQYEALCPDCYMDAREKRFIEAGFQYTKRDLFR